MERLLNKCYVQMAVLVAETRKHLQHILGEFKMGCVRMGLKINVGNSSVGG